MEPSSDGWKADVPIIPILGYQGGMDFRHILLLAMALLISSCDRRSNASPDNRAGADTIKVTNPYPDAVEVRLFVQNDWSDQDGTAVFYNPDGTSLNESQRSQFELSLIHI